MYNIILAIHNILRWVVLILGALAVIRAWWGWLGSRKWNDTERMFGLFFSIGIDIQLLLGLLLYFFLSPLTKAALQNFSAAMSAADMRFFALEHSLYMLVAVVCAHLGSILARRAHPDKAKFQRAAIFFSVAFLAILLGMPWTRPLLPGF